MPLEEKVPERVLTKDGEPVTFDEEDYTVRRQVYMHRSRTLLAMEIKEEKPSRNITARREKWLPKVYNMFRRFLRERK